jgi:hypothetical protein
VAQVKTPCRNAVADHSHLLPSCDRQRDRTVSAINTSLMSVAAIVTSLLSQILDIYRTRYFPLVVIKERGYALHHSLAESLKGEGHHARTQAQHREAHPNSSELL